MAKRDPNLDATMFIDTGMAAKMLDVSTRTLERWRQGLDGPHFHRSGGLVRYRVGDVIRWAERNPTRHRRRPPAD